MNWQFACLYDYTSRSLVLKFNRARPLCLSQSYSDKVQRSITQNRIHYAAHFDVQKQAIFNPCLISTLEKFYLAFLCFATKVHIYVFLCVYSMIFELSLFRIFRKIVGCTLVSVWRSANSLEWASLLQFLDEGQNYTTFYSNWLMFL